jgi:hypothetical protein
MWSEVKVREDVVLRLAHSAKQQPHDNDTGEHYRGLPANSTNLPQKLEKSQRVRCRMFGATLD